MEWEHTISIRSATQHAGAARLTVEVKVISNQLERFSGTGRENNEILFRISVEEAQNPGTTVILRQFLK